MRLKKPCIHVDSEHPEGRYEPHNRVYLRDGRFIGYACQGGEFLPEGALVIEREDGVEKIGSVVQPLILDIADYGLTEAQEKQIAIAVLDALNALGDTE